MNIDGNVGLLVGIAAGFAGLVAGLLSLIMTTVLRDRSRSRYDDEHNKALISAMRASYESQIADLTRQMTATEQRWRDSNHLLVAAQQVQSDEVGRNRVTLTAFMREMGMIESDLGIDPRLIFVLTPFSDAEDRIYDRIRDLCSRNGFRCVRGDEDKAEGAILPHIVRLMVRARIVIANITSRNPNVFYELGIAHSIGKPTILVSRTIDDVPFDIKTRRIVLFSNDDDLERRLTEYLLRALADVAV